MEVNCPMRFSYMFNLSFTNQVLNIEFVSEISYSQCYLSDYVTYLLIWSCTVIF